VATAILAEVGGEAVASANAKEKGKVIKGVIADCLTGENGRPKRERWVPRWMAFPPSAYTGRGGVATITAADRARWIAEQERPEEPDPDAPASAAALPAEIEGGDPAIVESGGEVEEQRLAA
jgi:ParB family chromosome partitioning protein